MGQVIHAWLPSIVSRAEDLNTRLPENEEDILVTWLGLCKCHYCIQRQQDLGRAWNYELL